jgi:Phage portal protein, SPP1 Gp6-like
VARWLINDLDQQSDIAHQEALTFGSSYVIVWGFVIPVPARCYARSSGGEPILAGKAETGAIAYHPDRIETWHADQAAANAGFDLVNEIDNPLGVVPVVPLLNSGLLDGVGPDLGYLYDFGHSEIDDLIPLVDGLNKLLTDMLVSAEYTARPGRWATGIELTEQPVLDSDGSPTGETVAVNPIPEGSRAMISEEAGAKFGQLDVSPLTGYENAVNVLLG